MASARVIHTPTGIEFLLNDIIYHPVCFIDRLRHTFVCAKSVVSNNDYILLQKSYLREYSSAPYADAPYILKEYYTLIKHLTYQEFLNETNEENEVNSVRRVVG